jgi:branched-chain amino acid transport system ATP-binding protein
VVALLGPNGAGKTTTLRAISGLARPAAGEIVFDGRRITGSSPPAVARAGIGHVHEGRKIFPAHTVEENLALGAYLLRKDRRAAAESMDEMLTLFPRLAERRRQLAGTLSGGEAQMLAIARALVARPALVMLDEPSLGLAPLVVEEIFEHLRNLRDHKHISMLLVEQAALLALEFAHRAYLLNTGRVGGGDDDPRGTTVRIQDSSAVVRGIAEGTIEWERDPDFGYEVATEVPGIGDAELLQPRRLYRRTGRDIDYQQLVARLRSERLAFLRGFPGLDPAVIAAVDR